MVKAMPDNGKPVNVRFEMMHAMMRHWGRNGLTYRDGIVWVALWDRAFKDNRVTRLPQDRLAQQLGISARHLRESLRRLENFQWIKRKRGGPGKPTSYTLHTPPGWETPDENSPTTLAIEPLNSGRFSSSNTGPKPSGLIGPKPSGLGGLKKAHYSVSSEEDIAARQPDCFGFDPSDAPSPFL